MIGKIVAVFDIINDWGGKALSFLVYPCVLVLLVEVVNRYVFNHTFIWSQETSTFLFGAVAVGAGGYVILHGGHITVDIITLRLSPRKKAVVEAALSVFGLFFVVLMLWMGYKSFLYAIDIGEKTNTAWRAPLWPIKSFLAIGPALMLLALISKLFKDLNLARGKG